LKIHRIFRSVISSLTLGNSVIKDNIEQEEDPNKTITDSSDSLVSEIGDSMNQIQGSVLDNQSESVITKPGKDEEKLYRHGRWTNEEHFRFIEAMLLYGNDWKKVQKHIGTRSPTQARSHAQKFFIRIKKKIFKDRPNQEPLSAEAIVLQVKSFVKNEILEKMMRGSDGHKYTAISDNKEKLSKVLLLMMSNFSKDKLMKGKILDLENINNFDYSIQEEDFLNWEKQTVKQDSFKSIRRASSKKNEIFSIEKTNSRKVSLEQDQMKGESSMSFNNCFGMSNTNAASSASCVTSNNTTGPVIGTPQNIFNNPVFTPSRNSYINIVTINVCKNDKDPVGLPFLEDNNNPLDMNLLDFNNKNANFINFINDPKSYKSVNNTILKPKKEDYNTFKTKQYSTNPYFANSQPSDIFNIDFTDTRNNLTGKFDDAQDEFMNNAFFIENINNSNNNVDKNVKEEEFFDFDTFFNN
jgi:SHAQKYF class myb-like DNA-binding protein